MAEENVTQAPEFLFTPDSCNIPEINYALLPGMGVQDYMDKVQDVASGAASALELLDWSESQPDCGGTAVLNRYHAGNITRLVVASLRMLTGETEDLRAWAYAHHTPRGQAERAQGHAKGL